MTDSNFEYGTAHIKDFKVKSVNSKGTGTVLLNDQELQTTARWWRSLQSRFRLSSNVFRYFDYDEVFNRVSERAGAKDEVRYCIERKPSFMPKVLGMTNPAKPVVSYTNLLELVAKYDSEGISYDNGIVTSKHRPRVGSEEYKILGEDFRNTFVIDTPVDGYGLPAVYLSLMRLVCENGMIGYSPSFRSELAIGKTEDDTVFNLTRAMDSFNNEEGYSALVQRIEAAQQSWASVRECNKLYKLLARLAGQAHVNTSGTEILENETGADVSRTIKPVLNAFHEMTGDLHQIYGMANLDTLTPKRQRILPAKCRVYDLLNFISELATHHTDEHGARQLHAMIGELIASDYDLEGTAEKFADFCDFFVGDEDVAEVRTSLGRRLAA